MTPDLWTAVDLGVVLVLLLGISWVVHRAWTRWTTDQRTAARFVLAVWVLVGLPLLELLLSPSV